MFEIDKAIVENFGLDIKGVTAFKDTLILDTSVGKRVLKKTSLPGDKILFIHGAKEHLFRNDFTRLDRYLCTTHGEPWITVGDYNYTLSEYIDGRECSFENRSDLEDASKLLASMHKASRGYIPPENSTVHNELGRLPLSFQKRADEIKKLRKVAKKGKSKFDYLFLDYVDNFYDTAQDAINMISQSNYDIIADRAKTESSTLCHHDFTHSNLICNNSGMHITNFEFCCFELKVYDIANLIRRKMRRCNWDICEAKIILDNYRSIEEISEDDFFMMRIILQFPQKFWRVANKYYNSRRSWSEKNFILRLQEVIDEIAYLKPFLDKYDSLW
jgi:CotS family spore coat protein